MNPLQHYSLLRLTFDCRRCDTCRKLFDRESEGHSDDSGDYCQTCRDAYVDEMDREFGWMVPHVQAANQARREGDHELARAITEGCGVRYEGPGAW